MWDIGSPTNWLILDNKMLKLNSKHNLVIFLSEKSDGTMSSSGFLVGEFDDRAVVKNREKFFNKIEDDPKSVVTMGCLHRSNIRVADKSDAGRILKNTDGLLTKEKNLFLSLSVADCLPVYLYDAKNDAVGLLHCGWRGVVANIIENGIKKMTLNFSSRPENILALIGPGISKCHFMVSKDVAKKFGSNSNFIDLKKVVREKLLKSGLLSKNITTDKRCTFCLKNNYFSFRRDKPKSPQTMLAVIGIKNNKRK